jgi:hypothetical protein
MSVFLIAAIPMASAQTQYVTASPGYINLGMTTSIQVTAPAAGQYTVVVVAPDGSQTSMGFTFTTTGQLDSAEYGNSTSGFGATVNQAGTYDVFLESGSQVVATTSFYATNRLLVSMDMVNGGTCSYIAGATRGTKMFPRFYIYFASTGTAVNNLDPGISVNYTLPDGSTASASWDRFAGLFVGKLYPTWNYSYVGPWSPGATIGDAAGNSASFQYASAPYVISPVELTTSIQTADAATGAPVTSLSDGLGVTISATITYPTNAEPVSGFVGPLDSATRGGVVTAQVGWGYYNETSGSFASGSSGGLIGTIKMSYTGSNGTWTGNFESGSLPKLPTGSTYEIAVTSKDKASPSNVGFAIVDLASAANQNTTVTATSTTTSVTTQSVVQTVQSIPSVVYAGLAILLILGVLIGYIVRVPR